jgi:hypothetical protein
MLLCQVSRGGIVERSNGGMMIIRGKLKKSEKNLWVYQSGKIYWNFRGTLLQGQNGRKIVPEGLHGIIVIGLHKELTFMNCSSGNCINTVVVCSDLKWPSGQ